MSEHNYSSRFKVKEYVKLDIKFPIEIESARITKIGFSESTVFHNVKIRFVGGGTMKIKGLHGSFIEKLDKPPHKPTAT